jgi:hypothetical protein
MLRDWFNERISEDHPGLAKITLVLQTRLDRLLSFSHPPPPHTSKHPPIYDFRPPCSFLKAKTSECVQQLMVREWDLWVAITPQELIEMPWIEEGSEDSGMAFFFFELLCSLLSSSPLRSPSSSLLLSSFLSSSSHLPLVIFLIPLPSASFLTPQFLFFCNTCKK